jgi:endonuclease/exonuclease/phosphatase family metal-dependent hydrolase
LEDFDERRATIASTLDSFFAMHEGLSWVNLQEIVTDPPDGGKSVVDHLGAFGKYHVELSDPTDCMPDIGRPLRMATITKQLPLRVDRINYGPSFRNGGYYAQGRLLEVVIPLGGKDITVANTHMMYIRPGTIPARIQQRDELINLLGELRRTENYILGGDFNTLSCDPTFRRVVAGRHAVTGSLRHPTWRWYRVPAISLNLDYFVASSDIVPTGVKVMGDYRDPSDHAPLYASFARGI